jgi:hypothetical protein
MTKTIIISIIHLVALALWAADSRVVDYFVSKINYRRSMPKIKEKEIGDDNPFVKDADKFINEKFSELIRENYQNSFGDFGRQGSSDYFKANRYLTLNRKRERKTKNSEMFYQEAFELEDLMKLLLDDLREKQPKLYKTIMHRALIIDSKRKRGGGPRGPARD